MPIAARGDPANHLVIVPDRLVSDHVGRVIGIRVDHEGDQPSLRPGGGQLRFVRRPARLQREPLFDPAGARMRA